MPSRRWSWETTDSDWGVELDEAAGLLRWWGADKPRPGVPAYAQGGGGQDQPIGELLRGARPPYDCPGAILADVLAAARGVRRTVQLPPVWPPALERVARLCEAAVRRLTGREVAHAARRLEVREVPDDRPDQTCATEYVTEVRLGELAVFRCCELYGAWSPGLAAWTTDDLAGRGPSRLDFTANRVEVEGAADVVELFAELLRAEAGPR